MGARAWVPVLAAGLLLGVLVAALVVGGGRPTPPPSGLRDAGTTTGWGRPTVDLAVRLLAVLTVGRLTYAALLAPAGTAAPGTPGTQLAPGAWRALRGSAWVAGAWLLAEGAGFVLTASAVVGVPVTGLSARDVAVVAGLAPGRSALWVGVLLAGVVVGALLAGRVRHPRALAGVLLVAALGAAVVPVVLTGHSATAADHVPAVVTLSVHVVAASLWLGGLAALVLHGRDPAEAAHAARRFSALALACVLLLAASGTGAVLLMAGPPTSAWVEEGWARLLLAKALALGALATMGWWHRRRTLPALAAGRPRAFLRLAVVEVGLMAAVIAVSVAMSSAPAPASVPADAPGETVAPGPAPVERGGHGHGADR